MYVAGVVPVDAGRVQPWNVNSFEAGAAPSDLRFYRPHFVMIEMPPIPRRTSTGQALRFANAMV